MTNLAHLLAFVLSIFLSSSSLFSEIIESSGTFSIRCGTRWTEPQFRIRSTSDASAINKSAMLLAGSPATEYLTQGNDEYEAVARELMDAGYKIIELRYPETRSSPFGAEGFYRACEMQGFANVKQHVGELFDVLVTKLQHDTNNPHHRLVGLGYSLGALQLQLMTHTLDKQFSQLALTGVLLGDVVTGCTTAIEHRRRQQLQENICTEPNIERGMSFGSFMHLVQSITTSGAGCCIEDGDGFGECKEGVRNEYTADLNIENQPYLKTSSPMAIFEGGKSCDDKNPYFYGGNPGQAHVIANARNAVGKPTPVFIYPACGHSLLSCAGEVAHRDILRTLVPEV